MADLSNEPWAESSEFIPGTLTRWPLDLGRCLVVCTVGNREPAIRRIWGAKPRRSAITRNRNAERTFQVAVINHGDTDIETPEGVRVFRWPGYKWKNIARLLDAFETGNTLGDFDYFWFSDDDVDISPEDVETLFETAHRAGFRLCQPSMSADSTELGWDITRQPARVEYLARPTNFVEIMCPLFRRDALDICRPTFNLTNSGWGLDFVWPKLLDYEGIGVIDAVAARHTEVGASPTWKFPDGKTSWDEMTEILAKHGLTYEQARAEVREL